MKETKKYLKYSKDTVKLFINAGIVLIMTIMYLITIGVFYDANTEFEYGIRGYIVLCILYAVITCTFYSLFGTFNIGNRRIIDISLSNIISMLFVNFTMYFVLGLIEGHLVLVWPYLGLFILQSVVSVFSSYAGTKIIRTMIPPQKALVIYGENNYKDVVKKLKKYQEYEFSIVKCIDEKDFNTKLIKELDKYDCLITINISHNSKKKIVKKCYELNKNIYDVPSITDVVVKSSSVTNFIDTPLFKMNKFGPSQAEKIIKRILDIVCAVLMLIVVSPLMLVISIIIKLQDGGDVFFRQKRLTIDGKQFELVKFRSMIMNAEPNGKMIKAKENDERITNIGKFIRRTRIDELPQLFNILTGSMSFVGPRALRIEEYKENEKSFPEFKYRLKVKAGLTGYAQIYGKYNTSFKDKLLLDIFYIENYNLIEDIKLLLMTAVTMFIKDSTEGF